MLKLRYCLLLMLLSSLKSTGDVTPVYLDASFGPNQNGTVITTVGDTSGAYALSLETDQDILAAGYSDNNQVIARYDVDGILDVTFGTDGIASAAFGESSTIYSTIVQADGKIVTAGISVLSGVSTLTLTRYTTTGVLDGSFGSSGSTLVPLGDGSGAYSIAIQNIGDMLLVAGVAIIDGTANLVLAQFDSDGIIDTSFGNSGIVMTTIGTSCAARAVQIQADGNIVIAGTANTPTGPMIFVSRYTPTGTLDASFGTNGVTTTAVPDATSTTGIALGLQSDGKLIVAGSTHLGDIDAGLVARYTTSGVLDTTFGSSGFVIISLDSTKATGLNNLEIDSDDSIITTGFNGNNSLIVKLTPSGAFDTTFGSSGAVVIAVANGSTGSDVAIQANGRYLMAGFVNPTETSASSILVARILNNNSPFILIETPANGSSLTTSTVTIQGCSSYAQATVQLTLNGVSLTPVTTTSTGSWNYGTSPLLLNGSNTLIADLYDGATLLTTDTSTFSVSITDSIVIEQPEDGSTVTSNTIAISGTSTQASQTVKAYIDGVLFSTVSTTAAGTWNAGTSSALTNSVHTITAELYQGATLLATDTATVTINGRDTILISLPVKGSTITTSTTPITGTSSGDTLEVNVFVDGLYFDTVTTTSSGDWDAGTSNSLSNGNHLILAQLTSTLGEVIATATNKFTVNA